MKKAKRLPKSFTFTTADISEATGLSPRMVRRALANPKAPVQASDLLALARFVLGARGELVGLVVKGHLAKDATEAAAVLGMFRATFYRHMKAHR